MEINWIWVLVSPLLQVLLTKFWQWVLDNETVRLKIATLYLKWLIHAITIKQLPPEEEDK